MKVVDYHTSENSSEKFGALGRLKDGLDSFQSRGGSKTQDAAIQALKKVLDNRFILLRGLVLPGLEPPAPLVLVGPSGIWLIEASPVKGVYRAEDNQWEEMDSQTQKFRPARVNLPARTALIAQQVGIALAGRGLAVQAIEPVIFFIQPGAHVEAVRPPARLVRSDAILRFAASLLQNPIVFSPEEIQAIIEALREPATAPPIDLASPELAAPVQSEGSPQVSSAKAEVLSSQLSAVLDTNEPEIIKNLSRRAAFSRRQWLILAALLVVNILILAAVIIIVLIIT